MAGDFGLVRGRVRPPPVRASERPSLSDTLSQVFEFVIRLLFPTVVLRAISTFSSSHHFQGHGHSFHHPAKNSCLGVCCCLLRIIKDGSLSIDNALIVFDFGARSLSNTLHAIHLNHFCYCMGCWGCWARADDAHHR